VIFFSFLKIVLLVSIICVFVPQYSTEEGTMVAEHTPKEAYMGDEIVVSGCSRPLYYGGINLPVIPKALVAERVEENEILLYIGGYFPRRQRYRVVLLNHYDQKKKWWSGDIPLGELCGAPYVVHVISATSVRMIYCVSLSTAR
jgi:hypothetical protein